MQEIVKRLNERRQIELAKSILESAGYAVSGSDDDTVMEFASDEEACEWAEEHGYSVTSMTQGKYGKACMAHLDKKREDLDEADEEDVTGTTERKDRVDAMRSNPTYKRMDALCTRFGYKLSYAYIETYPSGLKVPSVNISTDRSAEYAPDIYFYGRKNGIKSVSRDNSNIYEIQTTSYGSLTLEEHAKFIDAVTRAHNLVDALSTIDYSTLYVFEDYED